MILFSLHLSIHYLALFSFRHNYQPITVFRVCDAVLWTSLFASLDCLQRCPLLSLSIEYCKKNDSEHQFLFRKSQFPIYTLCRYTLTKCFYELNNFLWNIPSPSRVLSIESKLQNRWNNWITDIWSDVPTWPFLMWISSSQPGLNPALLRRILLSYKSIQLEDAKIFPEMSNRLFFD